MKKVILITGSTDGIGKLAAVKFANKGHKVVIHGRSESKLNDTIEEIKAINNQSDIIGFVADLAEPKNVKDLAQQITKKLPYLDVLINNAGVFNSAKQTNSFGIDMRFAVNYFAPIILTSEIVPIMKGQSDPRIINLSSAAQQTVSIDDLAGTNHLADRSAYAQSKLALTMWSFHLGKELSKLTVIPVNPGSLLDTKMVREAFGTTWSSADRGADILLQLALDENHKGVKGKYFDNDKGNPIGSYGDAHNDAYDDKLIDNLMDHTNKIISSFNL